MSAAARYAAWRRGRAAEWAACLVLRLKGHRILARNVKTTVGEIDIIARRGSTLCFVEVKYRESREAAAQAIRPHQRQRIERAAAIYLQRRPALEGLDLRFDAVLAAPGRWPLHMADAWRSQSNGA